MTAKVGICFLPIQFEAVAFENILSDRSNPSFSAKILLAKNLNELLRGPLLFLRAPVLFVSPGY